MIFSIGDHIEQIKAGTKTQTRRPTDRYKVGGLYAVQPGRGKKGTPDGKIRIFRKWREIAALDIISWVDAEREGGYTIMEYEKVYSKMYPNWFVRWAYDFRFIHTVMGNDL